MNFYAATIDGWKENESLIASETSRDPAIFFNRKKKDRGQFISPRKVSNFAQESDSE
jgi:hypothetical protein